MTTVATVILIIVLWECRGFVLVFGIPALLLAIFLAVLTSPIWLAVLGYLLFGGM